MSRVAAPPQPRRDPRGRALLAAVEADPGVPRRTSLRAPGGYGKSALLGQLAARYRAAGVAVLDAWSVPAEPPEPAVLLVDDAHLLAGSRLEWLRGVVESRPVGLLLAYRPWPRPAGLAELAEAAGPVLTLCPLTEAQTAEYLGGRPHPELVGFVHSQTGGVPRLVDRLAPALAWPRREIPGSVLAQFQSDLEGLDADLRAVLLALAADAELTADLLAAVLDQPEPAGPAGILEAVRATGLLATGGGLVPLARQAVVQLTPPTQREEVWRRLAESQLARGGGVLPLARRLRELGAGGRALSGLFETAAAEALPEEPALAAELFAATAGARPGGSRRALAAALAGDLDQGMRLADPLITAATAEDRAAGAAVAATALAHRGQLRRSAELYAWSATPTSVAFATVGFLGTGAPARVPDRAPDGPPTLLSSAAALMADGVRESVTGSPTAALSTLVQSAALLEPAGRSVLLPDSPAALATLVAVHSGELEIAESVLARAVAVRMGSRLMARRHLLLRAWLRMVRGDTAPAAELRRVAVAGAVALEPRDLLFATALEVGLARRDSDLPGMLRAWGSARDAVMRHSVDLFSLLPLGELAVAAARLGEQARLQPHLRQAYELLDQLQDPPLWTSMLHWYAVHAAILAEDAPAAEAHVAALAAGAGRFRFATVLAAAARTWVAVLRGSVDPDRVEATARELHAAGLSWDAARLAGQAAIRTSDRQAMTRLLDCARALRGRSAPAADRLSGREREVAALLVDGLTYKEIGARLFISAKTVEHHVARMRQRLGCATRSDLLARLRSMARTDSR